MDVIKILESSTLFASLNKRILWRIANLAEQKHFAKGTFLLKEGAPAEHCLIITSGRVEIYRELNLAKRLHITELGTGEILGELAIIDGLPHSASVVALEESETLAISAWDFKAQLQAYPEIALELLPVIAKRLRHTQNQLIELKQHE